MLDRAFPKGPQQHFQFYVFFQKLHIPHQKVEKKIFPPLESGWDFVAALNVAGVTSHGFRG